MESQKRPGLRGKIASALKTAFVLTAVTGLAVGCAAGDNGTPTGDPGGETPDVIKIGAILPLTGATAQNGENSLRGIQVAIELINEAGGIKSMNGAKLELVTADATSDAATAANAATEFLSGNDNPLAIIGAYASGLTTTVARVTERARIPLLSTSFSDALTQQGYEYFFQIPAPASQMGTAQMDFAIEIMEDQGSPIQNVAIVFANNAYGEEQGAALRAQAEAAGMNIVLFEGYAPNIVDAGPVVQKIQGSNADAVFSIAYVQDGVLLMRAVKQAGLTIPIFGGTGGYITPDFVEALGDGVNGLFSVTTSNPEGYGEVGQAYLEKFGQFMPQEAHDNAAGVYIIAEALEKNPTTDPEVLKETLHSTVFTLGAAGQMPNGQVEFDETGANQHGSPLMVQWQDQQLVGVWPKDIVQGSPIW